jgi:hypothetical protein
MFSFFTTTAYTKVTVVEEFDNAKYATKPVSDPHPTHAQPKATPTPPRTKCSVCTENGSYCMVATMGKLEVKERVGEFSAPTYITCSTEVNRLKLFTKLPEIDETINHNTILASFPDGWAVHRTYRDALLNRAIGYIRYAIARSQETVSHLSARIQCLELSVASEARKAEDLILRELISKKQLMESISAVFAKQADYLGMTLQEAQSHFSTPSCKTHDLLYISATQVSLLTELPSLRSGIAQANARIERFLPIEAELKATLQTMTNQ